jgi:hypothetical protein
MNRDCEDMYINMPIYKSFFFQYSPMDISQLKYFNTFKGVQ